MSEHRGERWMTLLINIWRHTPLGIMLTALTRPKGEQRTRQVNGVRSNPSREIVTP
jgi:hypothetical protein